MKEVMTDKKSMSTWEVGNGAVINTIDCITSSAKAIAYAKVSLQVKKYWLLCTTYYFNIATVLSNDLDCFCV
jgi:hypothetical protein